MPSSLGGSSRSAAARRRAKARKQRMKVIGILVLLVALVIGGVLALARIVTHVNKNKEEKAAQTATTDGSGSTSGEKGAVDYSIIRDGDAQISKFFYYGTHFNFTGTMDYEAEETDAEIETVTARVYATDKVGLSTYTQSVEMDYTLKNDVLSFQVNEYIDEGINLEIIPEGEYIVVMAITNSNGNTYLYGLEDVSEMDDLVYYTLTKDGSNNQIDIAPATMTDENGVEIDAFSLTCQACELPDDVYDIVIDPGHGTYDGGASSTDNRLDENGNNYLERDLVLLYAKELKEILEGMGYKVILTHDGSEGVSGGEWAYWNAFQDGNRVWTACHAKAKYCVSLHLNSASEMTRTRGVEVYSCVRAGTRLGALFVENITTMTSMPASGKTGSGLTEIAGLYKYKSNDDPTSDYLYMIREIGGVVTGAYVHDSEKLGTNAYWQANYGPEGFLIEMGYLTDDDNTDIILNEQTEYVTAIATSLDTDIKNMQAGE